MNHNYQSHYDEPAFFEKYSRMDRSRNGLQAAGEWPTLEKMLPDFTGKRVLDLGCGYGWHCEYAVQHGAVAVTGVDLSERMLAEARANHAHEHITYLHGAIEEVDFAPGSFDVALSSLALHYVRDFGEAVRRVHRFLTPGGAFVFSCEHPMFTAEGHQDWLYDSNGRIVCFPVDNYFYEGERQTVFLGESVRKYHRTLSTILTELLNAGFELTGVQEPQPPERLMNVPGMKDELRRPMMLIVSARKAQ